MDGCTVVTNLASNVITAKGRGPTLLKIL